MFNVSGLLLVLEVKVIFLILYIRIWKEQLIKSIMNIVSYCKLN